MSHPSLGLPPRDLSAGHPAAASTLRAARARIATRTLETAVDAEPEFRERYSELALRELLSDVGALVDQLATAVAAADPDVLRHWAEMVAPRYRKRQVPMDHLVAICEALRATAGGAVDPGAAPTIDAAIDAAIEVFRWHRRLGGDARKRNPVIHFIYKGA